MPACGVPQTIATPATPAVSAALSFNFMDFRQSPSQRIATACSHRTGNVKPASTIFRRPKQSCDTRFNEYKAGLTGHYRSKDTTRGPAKCHREVAFEQDSLGASTA